MITPVEARSPPLSMIEMVMGAWAAAGCGIPPSAKPSATRDSNRPLQIPRCFVLIIFLLLLVLNLLRILLFSYSTFRCVFPDRCRMKPAAHISRGSDQNRPPVHKNRLAGDEVGGRGRQQDGHPHVVLRISHAA